MNGDFAALTDRQQLALRFAAIRDDQTLAETRRQALRTAADQALADPQVAANVTAALRYRRHQSGALYAVPTTKEQHL